MNSLSKPEVTAPIVGASKMHHLDDAIKALDLRLDVEEIKALEEPSDTTEGRDQGTDNPRRVPNSRCWLIP